MNEIDEIRWQMARIRRDLHRDVSEVVVGAEKATDWRTYVRDQPWLAVGAALALGYLLVPRARRTHSTVVVTPVDQSNGARSAFLAAGSEGGPKPRSLLSWAWKAFGFIRPVALQAAQGYAGMWLENLLAQNPPSTFTRSSTRRPVATNGPSHGAYQSPPPR